MKKSITTTIVLLISVTVLIAQEVISANGGTANVVGTQVSWTIGEPVVTTVFDTNNTLTQGFHQSKLTVTVINNFQVAGVVINVYPNPTANYVIVHFSEALEKTAYFLFDQSGRIIGQKKIESTGVKIDMTKFAAGLYILKLNSGQRLLQTFKIVKR